MFSEGSHLPPPVHYWQDHRGLGSPLAVISRHVRKHSLPLPDRAVAELAARTGLLDSTIRRAADYYRSMAAREDHPPLMVCQGTACRLAGSGKLRDALEKRKLTCHGVACLGYCDAAPALLDERDAAYTGEAAAEFHEHRGFSQSILGHPLPRMESLSATPLILPRLLQGGAATLKEALSMGVYEGLRSALQQPGQVMLDLVAASGLSGSQGRVAPRWQTCAATDAVDRYVIGHAHAGTSGAVVDRLLLERDPHSVLEGLALAARAVGASHGILFIPADYPQALQQTEAAIREATAANLLGRKILKSHWSFQVSLFPGAARCAGGEATALIDAIETLRGQARPQPPAPEVAGLHRLPTLVEPLETLVQLGTLAKDGSAAWTAQGTAECPGTRVFCLNQGFAHPGLVEVPHGHNLRDLIENWAGGGAMGSPLEALILGGLGGSLLGPGEWDLTLCPSRMTASGLRLGNGSLVAIAQTADHRDVLSHFLEYMDGESCGKCTPCRLGPAGVVTLAARYERLARVDRKPRDATRARRDLETLFHTMELGSLCSFGQDLPGPMRRFIDLFWDRIFTKTS